jgi:hypothetical protein
MLLDGASRPAATAGTDAFVGVHAFPEWVIGLRAGGRAHVAE